MEINYTHLLDELDIWATEGLKSRFWVRDDDAVSYTKQIQNLFEIFRSVHARIAIAVIPKHVEESLANYLQKENCCAWQHGWSHDYHKFGEFGEERPLELMIEEALNGKSIMNNLFGLSGWQKVFVPPHQMLSLSFKARIHQLGYLGISAGNPLTPKLKDILEVNVTLDLMDWDKRRVLNSEEICQKLLSELQARRYGKVPFYMPLGILTHHLAFDTRGWQELSKLIDTIYSHPAVKFEHADELFFKKITYEITQEAYSSSSIITVKNSKPSVTMVVTSCGRYDLLRRTLSSFFKFNTYPLYDIIVIEDGRLYDIPNDLLLDNRISFIATCHRVGQIKAIDQAYKHVNTEYIFHCEDDWEFFAPGFIEKSLEVLMSNEKIIQVWLRALNDTSGHPIHAKKLYAGNVEYKVLDTNYGGEKNGIWHGFSFNPGLKRNSDYQMLGSYGNLDPQNKLIYWEIESEISKYYFEKGYVAAILADNSGKGYCKHIGNNQHVTEAFTIISIIRLVYLRLKTPGFNKRQTVFIIIKYFKHKLKELKLLSLKKSSNLSNQVTKGK